MSFGVSPVNYSDSDSVVSVTVSHDLDLFQSRKLVTIVFLDAEYRFVEVLNQTFRYLHLLHSLSSLEQAVLALIYRIIDSF